jgi:hypothetical protein
MKYGRRITGMNPRASPGSIFLRKQRGIIPSDFVGIACLAADRFDYKISFRFALEI